MDGGAEGRTEVDWALEGLGERMNAIVDAVEREAVGLRQEAEDEAARIRQQAQEEARLYLDDVRRRAEEMVDQRVRRISEIGDALMARAEEVIERLEYAIPVKSELEGLVRALGETADRLARQDYSELVPPDWPAPPTAAEQRRFEAQPQPAAASQQLEDAHRVAIEMAASGATRREVEAHLGRTPGSTRSSVLDEVFGPGTSPDSAAPWVAPSQG